MSKAPRAEGTLLAMQFPQSEAERLPTALLRARRLARNGLVSDFSIPDYESEIDDEVTSAGMPDGDDDAGFTLDDAGRSNSLEALPTSAVAGSVGNNQH